MSAVLHIYTIANYRALFVEFSDEADGSQATQLQYLHLVSLRVLQEVISFTPSILTSDISIGLSLLLRLYMTNDDCEQNLQSLLMDVLLLIFKRDGNMKSLSPLSTVAPSHEVSRQRSITRKKGHIKENVEDALGPVSLLLHTILDALSLPKCRPLLSTWARFFLECLQFFSDSIFQILIPTVESVGREFTKTLSNLQELFISESGGGENLLDQSVTLLNLLEGVLFRAYEILRAEELKLGNSKGNYDGAGFLNNVMLGVWSGDGGQGRSVLVNVCIVFARLIIEPVDRVALFARLGQALLQYVVLGRFTKGCRGPTVGAVTRIHVCHSKGHLSLYYAKDTCR